MASHSKKADLLTIEQHVLASVPYNWPPLIAKRHKLEIEKTSASPVELLAKHVSRYDESMKAYRSASVMGTSRSSVLFPRHSSVP